MLVPSCMFVLKVCLSESLDICEQNNKTLTAVSSSRGGRTSSCQAVTAREEAKHWQVVHRIDKARAQLNSHTLLFVWIA